MSLLWENLVLCSSHAWIFWLVSANSSHCRVSHATNRLSIACIIKKLEGRQWSKTKYNQNLPHIFDFTFCPQFWARSDPVGGKGIIYPKMSGRTGIRASAPPANNTPYEDSGTLAQKAPFAARPECPPREHSGKCAKRLVWRLFLTFPNLKEIGRLVWRLAPGLELGDFRQS